jgi:hypothetical protein
MKDLAPAALEDFWVFCNEVLFTRAGRQLEEKPHREMVEYLSEPFQPNKMMLVPRDSLKTTISSTAYPLWMVLRAHFLDDNPGYRVLIDSATVRLSKFVIGQIKQWVKNECEPIFGPLYDRKGDNAEGLSLSFKLKSSMVKEPNFVASGVGAEKTGLHFELIVLDDIVTKDNVRSVMQREKVWEHYRMMQAILESDTAGQRTRMIIVGTRYSDDDLYGRIILADKERVAEEKAPRYAPMIRAAQDESGELFYPSKLSVDVLADKRAAMGTLFWAQYMNDPSRETAPLKEDQLHWHPLFEFPELRWIRLSVDPAYKEEERVHGDANAIVVMGWDRFMCPWILDVSLRRDLTPERFVDLFFRMCVKYQVDSAIIENAHQEAMDMVLRKTMKDLGYHVPIFWERPQIFRGKASRWLDIQAWAERSGGIKIAQEIDEATKIEILDEWTRAPFSRFDDFLDALQLQTLRLPVDMASIPGRPIVGRTATDVIEVGTRSEGPTPYFGTLADRFPNIAALQPWGQSLKDADVYVRNSDDMEPVMEEVLGS